MAVLGSELRLEEREILTLTGFGFARGSSSSVADRRHRTGSRGGDLLERILSRLVVAAGEQDDSSVGRLEAAKQAKHEGKVRLAGDPERLPTAIAIHLQWTDEIPVISSADNTR